jgi:hypothetical protein
MGAGPMTGGGFGFCADGAGLGLGRGMGWRRGGGCGRGVGRGFAADRPMDGAARRALLVQRKAALEGRLTRVNAQLERL